MTTAEVAPRAPRPLRLLADDGAMLAVQVHDPATGSEADAPVTTLVLAHGWTLTHATWEPVVRRLAGRPGLRVVTWDQRGHGGSTLAGGRFRQRGLSIRTLAGDLQTVLGAVAPDGPLVLGGHSMGGMTIMAWAGMQADVVAQRLQGAALVATSAGGLASGLRRGQLTVMRTMAAAPAVRPGRLVTTRGQRQLLFGVDADEAAVAATRAQVATTRLPVVGGFHAALMAHDELGSLAALDGVPVTVLVGDHDRLTSVRHARTLAGAMPHARLEVVEGAGHMLTYEAPDRVTASLEALLLGSRTTPWAG